MPTTTDLQVDKAAISGDESNTTSGDILNVSQTGLTTNASNVTYVIMHCTVE